MPIYTPTFFISLFLFMSSIILFCHSFDFSKGQESRENLIVIPEPGDYNITDGTDRSDIVIGNRDINVIVGEESDDVLMGRQANDELHGDEGNDVLQGNLGADILFGNDGDDVLFGGAEEEYM